MSSIAQCQKLHGFQTAWRRAPSLAAETAQTKCCRRTICNGILDSYRKSKGLQSSTEPVSAKLKKDLAASPVLTFESQDDDTCPAECVIEVNTPEEFKNKCQEAGNAVVVLDLYKTSCGACKYLMPGFLSICKTVYGTDQPQVVFLKHNVYDDELEEKTDLARRLRVQGVPKFFIFKNMILVDEFSTRDKKQLVAAINKHSGFSAEEGPLSEEWL